jgi:hypothetical protein
MATMPLYCQMQCSFFHALDWGSIFPRFQNSAAHLLCHHLFCFFLGCSHKKIRLLVVGAVPIFSGSIGDQNVGCAASHAQAHVFPECRAFYVSLFCFTHVFHARFFLWSVNTTIAMLFSCQRILSGAEVPAQALCTSA